MNKVIKTKAGRQVKLGSNIYNFHNPNQFTNQQLLTVVMEQFSNEIDDLTGNQINWQEVREESKLLQLEEIESQFSIL